MIRALFPYHVGTLLVYFHECELNHRQYQKSSTVNRPKLFTYQISPSILRKRTRISLDDTLNLGTNTHPQICNPFLNIVKVERMFLVI